MNTLNMRGVATAAILVVLVLTGFLAVGVGKADAYAGYGYGGYYGGCGGGYYGGCYRPCYRPFYRPLCGGYPYYGGYGYGLGANIDGGFNNPGIY